MVSHHTQGMLRDGEAASCNRDPTTQATHIGVSEGDVEGLFTELSVSCLLSPSGPQVGGEGLGENHVRPSLVVLELGSWEVGV